jgi:DNA-binding NarL/FixJ family response regulator
MRDFRHRTRIITVENHTLLRSGLAALIDGEADLVLVHNSANADSARLPLAELRPDVVIVDAAIPGALDLVRWLRRGDPDLVIIFLVRYEWDEVSVRAIEAGASAFLARDRIREDLLKMIREGRGCGIGDV